MHTAKLQFRSDGKFTRNTIGVYPVKYNLRCSKKNKNAIPRFILTILYDENYAIYVHNMLCKFIPSHICLIINRYVTCMPRGVNSAVILYLRKQKK